MYMRKSETTRFTKSHSVKEVESKPLMERIDDSRVVHLFSFLQSNIGEVWKEVIHGGEVISHSILNMVPHSPDIVFRFAQLSGDDLPGETGSLIGFEGAKHLLVLVRPDGR